MKTIKNIYGKDINVVGKLLKANKTMKVDDSLQEIKNLVRHGYIKIMESKKND